MSLRYDPEDGQVFTEDATREFSISKWLSKSLGIHERFGLHRNSFGAASLQDMIMRSILSHLSNLDSDALRSLPWDPFGQKLWNYICAADLVSVMVWKTFATTYGQKVKPVHYRPSQLFKRELSPMIPYISAPNLEWLTILVIDTMFLELHEWMQIGTIPNLAALAVYELALVRSLKDRVMRAWADHAQQGGAFPELELFVLISRHSQSPDCLGHLAFLPKLQTVHIEIPPIYQNDVRQQTNWLSKEPKEGPLSPNTREALYELLGAWRSGSTINSGSIVEKPVLNVFHGELYPGYVGCMCTGKCRAWYQRSHNNPEVPNDRPVPDNQSQTRDAGKAIGHKRPVRESMKRSLEDMLGDF